MGGGSLSGGVSHYPFRHDVVVRLQEAHVVAIVKFSHHIYMGKESAERGGEEGCDEGDERV